MKIFSCLPGKLGPATHVSVTFSPSTSVFWPNILRDPAGGLTDENNISKSISKTHICTMGLVLVTSDVFLLSPGSLGFWVFKWQSASDKTFRPSGDRAGASGLPLWKTRFHHHNSSFYLISDYWSHLDTLYRCIRPSSLKYRLKHPVQSCSICNISHPDLAHILSSLWSDLTRRYNLDCFPLARFLYISQ